MNKRFPLFNLLLLMIMQTCIIKEELPPEPNADFEFQIANDNSGKVTFTNTSKYASYYLWDFGNDNTADKVTPIHTYTKEGIYTVLLIAHGFGKDTISKQIQIIFNQQPTNILLSNDTILENQPAGTWVGILSTVDPDVNDTHIYSLVSGNGSSGNSSFAISNDQLRSSQSFDYETQTIYSIRVRTDDNKGGTFEKIFLINIKDLFEGIPNNAPTNIILNHNIVCEKQPINTLVSTFTTTDPDVSDTHTYSLVPGIGSRDNNSFTIVGNELRTNDIFYYSIKNSYSIRVSTDDGKGGIFEKVFIIRIEEVDITSDLLLYLPFNGNADDASGNDNHGTVYGATLVAGDTAYSFDGVDDYIEVAHSSSFEGLTQLTLAAWVTPKGFFTGPCQVNEVITKEPLTSSNYGGLFSLIYVDDNNGLPRGCGIMDPNHIARFAIGNSSGYKITDAVSSSSSREYIILNETYFLVGTYDGRYMKLYINGELIEEKEITHSIDILAHNTNSLFIGKVGGLSSFFVNGIIDEVRIYNRALALKEILVLYRRL